MPMCRQRERRLQRAFEEALYGQRPLQVLSLRSQTHLFRAPETGGWARWLGLGRRNSDQPRECARQGR
jgi:hypothetical protein